MAAFSFKFERTPLGPNEQGKAATDQDGNLWYIERCPKTDARTQVVARKTNSTVSSRGKDGKL